MRFIGKWLVSTVACAAAIWLVPGIVPVGGTWVGALFCALVLALLNASVKPVLQILSAPITLLTLGLFYVVVNALVLELASWLSLNLFGAGIAIYSLGSAIMGAIIISIVSMLLSGLIGND
ncbi:phage holin family protein [Thermophilibacter sp.]